MHRRILGLSVVIVAFGGATALANTVIIGNVSQSNSQAVNSSQSGSNGSGGGSTFILGNSSPTLTQTSVNVLCNSQTIGSGGSGTCASPVYASPQVANFTLIGNASQLNNQAVNSQQAGVNGGGGSGTSFVGGHSAPRLLQNSFNLLISDVILG